MPFLSWKSWKTPVYKWVCLEEFGMYGFLGGGGCKTSGTRGKEVSFVVTTGRLCHPTFKIQDPSGNTSSLHITQLRDVIS